MYMCVPLQIYNIPYMHNSEGWHFVRKNHEVHNKSVCLWVTHLLFSNGCIHPLKLEIQKTGASPGSYAKSKRNLGFHGDGTFFFINLPNRSK